jgi:hypothetical protein
MNTGGYMSAGDDPARVTWFEDEMLTLGQTAQQLGLPLAVHTGAAEGCKQALRAGARSLEHCYLIDDEGVAMAEKAGAFLVPTMQMTREDKALLKAGKLPEHAVWKFRRDVAAIEEAQKHIARSKAKVSTDCGMFPFSERRSRVSGYGGGGPRSGARIEGGHERRGGTLAARLSRCQCSGQEDGYRRDARRSCRGYSRNGEGGLRRIYRHGSLDILQ